MGSDVVILGGGPGGTAASLYLSKYGLSSTIIEKEQFPRFHIGESLTAESGNYLRELGLEDEMAAMDHPVKYGLDIYSPSGRTKWWFPIMSRTDDGTLVDSTTWQVRRSEFDKFLLDRAVDHGADLITGRAVEAHCDSENRVHGVRVETADGDQHFETPLLIDATGQSTFLANQGMTGPKHRGYYARQVAIYSHFEHAERDPGPAGGNTLIFLRDKYFWAWFIPIDDRITSVGVVVPSEYFRGRSETTADFLTRELAEFNRELGRRMADAVQVADAHATSNYSYRVENFTGPNWLCVGDAHRFIDPLFSFGVNMAIADGRQAAIEIARLLGDADNVEDPPFREYENWSEFGMNTCQSVLDGFWASTWRFGVLMRYHLDDYIDLLSGRVRRPYPVLDALRMPVDHGGSEPNADAQLAGAVSR